MKYVCHTCGEVFNEDKIIMGIFESGFAGVCQVPVCEDCYNKKK